MSVYAYLSPCRLQSWESFTTFAVCALMGCTDSAESSPKLQVLGEAFFPSQFQGRLKKIPSRTPLAFEHFSVHNFTEALRLFQYYMGGFVPTLTLRWAQGFNISPNTTIKPKPLDYRNQQIPRGQLQLQSQLASGFSDFSFILVDISLPFFVKIGDAFRGKLIYFTQNFFVSCTGIFSQAVSCTTLPETEITRMQYKLNTENFT